MAEELGVAAKWVKSDGGLKRPPNDGFADGAYVETTLSPGMIIDRYGSESGNFLSPKGTSFGERALPTFREKETPKVYKVIKPIPVKEGKAAAWFDQPGGGTQFQTEMSINDLWQKGYLEKVEP